MPPSNARCAASRCRDEKLVLRFSPDRVLSHWVLAWFALSVASVALVGLRPLVVGVGLLLIAAIVADAWLSGREAGVEIEREVPEKGSRGKSVEIVLALVVRLYMPENYRYFTH